MYGNGKKDGDAERREEILGREERRIWLALNSANQIRKWKWKCEEGGGMLYVCMFGMSVR
jgi:hypothetical protein